MLNQATRMLAIMTVFGAMALIAPAVASAQDAGSPAVQNAAPPAAQASPAATPAPPVSPWAAYLHDPYYGTPQRPYGTATTVYYPWPGKPYYGPRYYGFRPGWFGAGYPTSDFAGFGW
ncbi:MAG: hypothetical protein MPJ50_02600 [Pirellulales bacterium]|nr:hypothetical protein [Pirellulales bacterium]